MAQRSPRNTMLHDSPYARMAIAIMSLLGLLDAAYLSLERLTGGQVACPVGGGCEVVQNSAYALFMGVPVAYIGVAGYAALLLVALLSLNLERVAGLALADLLLALGVVALLFGIYLSYLQVAVIGAICFWCVVAALLDLGICLAALAHWRAQRSQPH
ncbi:MAG: vitamin K epoxide reductase family protein [Kouleothrix sp.]|nr:vitamin K epoxide reductase family protein [Kouleothrix sp.]